MTISNHAREDVLAFPTLMRYRFLFISGSEINRLRKYLKFILLFLFAAFFLWIFVRKLNWQEVSQSLRQANGWYLALAAAIISFGYLLRAIRWKVLLEPLTPSSLKELFATTTVGFAAILIVGRAGEIVRPMWLPMRDRRVRPSAALVTLGLERIFDLAALASFFAINLLWFDPPAGRETEFEYLETVGYALLGSVFVGFIALYIYQRISDRVIRWTSRILDRTFIPKRVTRIVISILEKLTGAVAILKDWREMLLVAFWSFMLWLAIAIPTWLVLAAFNLGFSVSDSIVIMGIAAVASVIPTPGGAAGAFHTATAASLIFLRRDMRPDDAAAVAIAMHLVYFTPALIFGLYYFLHGDISIERFRSLLSSEHAVEEIESEAPNHNGQLKTESGQ
jgi:uncharacterized protein (TIRG00374 family)